MGTGDGELGTDGTFSDICPTNSWWHYLPTTWLVDTELSPEDFYRELKPRLLDGDHILITGLSRDCYGWLPKKAWEWIRRHEAEIP